MVSELFLRGVASAVSGCRTPGNREREFWDIVVFQFDVLLSQGNTTVWQ